MFETTIKLVSFGQTQIAQNLLHEKFNIELDLSALDLQNLARVSTIQVLGARVHRHCQRTILFLFLQGHLSCPKLIFSRTLLVEGFVVKYYSFLNVQDGGSLDQILKKADQLPEDILGKITVAVSANFQQIEQSLSECDE